VKLHNDNEKTPAAKQKGLLKDSHSNMKVPYCTSTLLSLSDPEVSRNSFDFGIIIYKQLNKWNANKHLQYNLKTLCQI